MEEKYTRECPVCGKIIEHKTKVARDDALKKVSFAVNAVVIVPKE